jgi:hypothetical protein
MEIKLTEKEQRVLWYLYTTLQTNQISKAIKLSGITWEEWNELEGKVFVKEQE